MTKKKKRRSKGQIVWSVMFAAALLVLCFSVFQLIKIFLDYKEGTDEYEELRQYTAAMEPEQENVTQEVSESDEEKTISSSESIPESISESELIGESVPLPPLTVDFESLKGINPDVCGWLYIEALEISYPVVQGADNDTYLHTTYEGKSNYAGSIFMDYQNSSTLDDCNTIIYGHNMKNLSMFGKLKQIKEQEKYKESIYFWILTPDENYRYQIYTAFYTEADGDVYTLFSQSGEEFRNYLEQMAGCSGIPVEVPEFDERSRVVTLSTCAARDSSQRFVVQGVRTAD
ncbi:MAG: class B sortase [Fusicatenibacter sp.]|nr:class B sortase [Fusicatenibacter sp.]